MENTRTFVIDGRRNYIALYVLSFILLISSLIVWAIDGLPIFAFKLIGLLISLGFHIAIVYRMTEKVTLDAYGVHYKIINRAKSHAWKDVHALGIARREIMSRGGQTVEFAMYASDTQCGSEQAWIKSFGGIRIKIPSYAVSRVADELRDFAGRYAAVEPYMEFLQ